MLTTWLLFSSSQKFHKLNFKEDPRVTSIHAAVMSDKNAKKEKTVTFR